MVHKSTYSIAGKKARTTVKSDRFKLEERIMRAWGTSDDLEDFITHFYEGTRSMTQDEVFNVVWGLKEIHDIRMQALMDCFKRTFRLDEYAPVEATELKEQFFNNKEGICDD